MNQKQATRVIAEYLEPHVGSVWIARAVEGDHRHIIMAALPENVNLSVTVEILAQP